jgi:hypothetical protein
MTHARLRSAISRTRSFKTRSVSADGSVTESVESVPDPNDEAALKAIWMLAQLGGVAHALPLEPAKPQPHASPQLKVVV